MSLWKEVKINKKIKINPTKHEHVVVVKGLLIIS